VLCDCPRPVFRKDEESAWTIVASAACSSLLTNQSASSDVRDDDASLHSAKHFSFTDDLLTAPVYKRVTLNMLSRSGTVPNPWDASSPSDARHLARNAAHPTRFKDASFEGYNATLVRWKSTASETSASSSDGPDMLGLIDQAAGMTFSSSTVSDRRLHQLGNRHQRSANHQSLKYLPIRASPKREQMTAEECRTIDSKLYDAVRHGSLDEIALSLDDGADINAVALDSGDTILHVAMMTYQDDSLASFLLQYKNVNIHVQNGKGQTLLHVAVFAGKVRAIRGLLDLGLSMTDEDHRGITPFNIAVESVPFTDPLSILLLHARMRGVDSAEMTDMDPAALHTVCRNNPICAEKALVLLDHGWSPAKRFRTVDGTNSERVSSLYLAVMQREVVLVEKMLRLPKDIVCVNAVHGPCPNLLLLAMDYTSGCALQLLEAGLDHKHFLQGLQEFAGSEVDFPLCKWLCVVKEQRDELERSKCKPKEQKAEELSLAQSHHDLEAEWQREKRMFIMRLEDTPAATLVL
jgi:ankyrin repeat protein